MNLKEKLTGILPPFLNERVLIKQKQGTGDIMKEILLVHNEYAEDYDLIYKYFDTGDVYSTCDGIWNFLKYNLVYNAETTKDQTVKSPGAILHPGEKIDCKHYALFAGGILDAIKQNEGDKWDWCYRFASDESYTNVSHVFVMVKDGNREYWLDPCLSNFDLKKKYYIEIDKKPMPLYKISGVGDTPAPQQQKTVIVDMKQAWESFLTITALDLFAMKTLMKQYPQITNGVVRQYFLNQGFDVDQFQNFLNS